MPPPPPGESAFETGIYPNLFRDYLAKSDAEIQAKINAAWDQLFYGNDSNERVYYPVGADMAYILDTGNDDVRSEGMSYGMMIAVQMNKREEFDRLWKWAKTYMYQTEGGYKGYFAWHCKPDGTQLAANPASDGEVWFITALFFADARWGSSEGIFNYRAEAQAILDVALHADELGGDLATNLFDPATKLVVFVPQLGQNSSYSDPSYHMPHFYELWALWADKDNDFWTQAVQASRDYLPNAVHPVTGLAPNYSYFDGSPFNDQYNGGFHYDAFRVGANVGMDYAWFKPGNWHVEQSNRLLDFFASQGINNYKAEYSLEGEPLVAHRSPGLIATNAVAALAADPAKGKPFVQAFWDEAIPKGRYRYYDGLLMMLGLLQVSGNFQIYTPGEAPQGQPVPTPMPAVTGKFSPPSGRALLLVGADAAGVEAYFNATVTAPGGVAAAVLLSLEGIQELEQLAGKYPNSTLAVTVDLGESLQAVADGQADAQVDALLEAMSGFQRPVYLRLAAGFDDPLTGTDPEVFRATWNRFHARIKALDASNLALVWESAASCLGTYGGHPLETWYPGDEFVDWIGLKYSDQLNGCQGTPIENTLRFARTHLKTVLLAASAPPNQDSAVNETWDGWFDPFFDFVKANNDVVRAVIYENLPDNPLWSNTGIVKLWKAETKQGFWLRGSPDLFNSLGFSQ